MIVLDLLPLPAVASADAGALLVAALAHALTVDPSLRQRTHRMVIDGPRPPARLAAAADMLRGAAYHQPEDIRCPGLGASYPTPVFEDLEVDGAQLRFTVSRDYVAVMRQIPIGLWLLCVRLECPAAG